MDNASVIYCVENPYIVNNLKWDKASYNIFSKIELCF